MGRKDVVELEDRLATCAGRLPAENGDDPSHFFAEAYPALQWFYEQAKADVAKLGLTEIVENAVRECIVLVKQGKRQQAQDLLFDACGALRQKSGTWDRMRRIYTASNDPTGR